MAKQDEYARYTIRVPADLYARLKEAAGEKSLNAEIVARLQSSLTGWTAETLEVMEHNQTVLYEALERIEKKIGTAKPKNAKRFQALVPVEDLEILDDGPKPAPGSRLVVDFE